jgi:RNA polymerase sigma-70 factor (ECF subfamily)
VVSELSDGELVERVRGGERQAEDALFRRHGPRLLGLLTRLLGSRADAEDALQDTLVLAFQRLASLREPALLSGWLTRIAVSQAHRRFRRRRLLRLLGVERRGGDATLASLAHPDISPEERAELMRLEAPLARLSGAERSAWMLRHVEDYELEEIADACDCSLATVKRRLAAAAERLRRGFGRGER